MWLLPEPHALQKRFEAFCEEKDFEFDHNEREFQIWMREGPEPD